MRSRLKRGSVALLVVPLALGGCDEGAPSASGPTVTDSAGVRIVHHPLGQDFPLWEVDQDGVLTLEGDPDSPPFRVRSAFQLSDGGFAVAEAGNHRVAFFDSGGRFQGSSGGEGEGPGEFQSLSLLSRSVGDTLLAWDMGSRRVSVLTPSGEFVRSFGLQTTEEVPFASVTAAFGDGSFLATGFVDTGGGPIQTGRRSYTSPSFHFGPDGAFLAHLGSFATPESYFETFDNGGFSVYPAPFGMVSHRLAVDSLFLTARSDSYELRLAPPGGEINLVIRRDPRNQPVTSALRGSLVEKLVAESAGGDPASYRRVLEEMEVPDRTPEFGRVFADRLGRIWVEEYDPLAEVTEWRVYGSDGVGVGALHLPEDFRPTDAGEDYILGVQTDEMGVESIVRHPIAAAAGGG